MKGGRGPRCTGLNSVVSTTAVTAVLTTPRAAPGISVRATGEEACIATAARAGAISKYQFGSALRCVGGRYGRGAVPHASAGATTVVASSLKTSNQNGFRGGVRAGGTRRARRA